MFKFSQTAARVLGAAIIAVAALSGTASAAPVQPKSVQFIANKMGRGCPYNINVRAIYYTQAAGHVYLQIQRDDGFLFGGQWVEAVPKGKKFRGRFKTKIPGVAGPLDRKYRAVISGLGTTKYSAWDRLKIKC